jgi:hypothetical protein
MKPLSYIKFYIENKIVVRDELCIKYNLSSQQVKQILNGLFQGGVLNTYKDNKIYGYLNHNFYKMRSLKEDTFLIELIKDINSMWKVLRSDIDTGYEYRGEVRRRCRIRGKHKSDYYKRLEGDVMSPIWKYLNKRSIRFFKEHDGFRSDAFVIPNELEQLVLSKTGYHVMFKWNKIEVDDCNV